MDPAVTESDRRWPGVFARESRRVRAGLAGLLTGPVEHVGSTAVVGLPAKPIIDMVAPVADLRTASDAVPVLRTLGYTPRPHRPEARLFVRVDPLTGLDLVHLHLTVPGSALWTERLAFRDALRADPLLVDRYASWKREHATGGRERAYDASKYDLVAEVLAAAGVDLAPDDVRLDPGSAGAASRTT